MWTTKFDLKTLYSSGFSVLDLLALDFLIGEAKLICFFSASEVRKVCILLFNLAFFLKGSIK